MPELGTTFGPDQSALLLAPDWKDLTGFIKLIQLDCGAIKSFDKALIFVAIVPEGAAMRMSHMPVTSFPISIKIVKTIPRQTTAPLNMRVIGIEKPIEA